MDIGDKIRKIRLSKGITQKQLSERLNTSQQNLAQYENGKRNPKIATLKKIAGALGVPVSVLSGDYTKEDYHMYRFSEIQEICKVLGISESELLGFDVAPEDYEGIKNPRVHEVHKRSDIRTGKLTYHKNDPITKALISSSNQEKQFLDFSVDILLNRELKNNFELLNYDGKKKLVDYSIDLLKIPDYQNGTSDQDNDGPDQTEGPELNIAHYHSDNE